MIFGQESETREFKRSTGETKDAMHDISAILNKSGSGELYFGIRNDGEVIGQQVSTKTLRNLSQAIGNHVNPRIYPTVEKVSLFGKDCISVLFEGSEPPYSSHGRYY